MTDAASPSLGERAVKDTAKQFGAQLIVGLSAAFFSAWLNRMLPAKELALWPICTSLGGVVAAFASFGLGDTYVRLVPALLAKGEREEASALLRTGLLVNLAGCVVLAICVYFLAGQAARFLLHDVQQAPLVQAMAFAAFFQALSERLSWAMQSVQEFGGKAVTNLATGLMRTPLAVALYIAMHGPRGVIAALTIVPILSCVMSVRWLWPHLSGSWKLRPIGPLLRFSLPFYGVSLSSLLSARANNLIIPLLASPEALATYFVAESIAGYVEALNKFAIGAVTPKIAEKNARDPKAISRVFTRCTRYAFLGLLPVHVLVAVAATPLLRLYGGAKYAGAGPVLVVMCAGMFVTLLYHIHRSYIQILARPVHLLGLAIAQGITNIVSLVLLAPPLGAMGAALSDGVVSVVQLGISAQLMRRTVRVAYDHGALAAAALASVVAGTVLWLVGRPLWGESAAAVVPALALAAVAYTLSLTRRLQAADAELVLGLMPQGLRQAGLGHMLGSGLTWLLVKRENRR